MKSFWAPTPKDDPPGGALAPAVVAFLVALATRAMLLVGFPDNIGLDGFQRWAGRDWLLVQGWLPGPQLVLWCADQLGLELFETRVVMAVLTSLAVAAGAVLAHAMGGRRAGWLYVPAGTFGPFALWGTAFYQEGLFLLLLLAGLALAVRGRVRTADVILGALGLVRFEALPLLFLYVLWRRRPEALVVSWGALVWFVGKALGWEGHASSPIDYFSDWHGLGARFDLGEWLEDVGHLVALSWWTCAIVYGAFAVLALQRPRTRGTTLMAAMVGTQLALVAVWMVGLERATQRMLVVPTMLTAVIAAVGIARFWHYPAVRIAAASAFVSISFGTSLDAWLAARREADWTRPERRALEEMRVCPDCRWWVEPRTALGPRNRHDGCEILQGVSDLRHGRDFLCAAWPADVGGASTCTGGVAWNGFAYVVITGAPVVPTPPLIISGLPRLLAP